MRTLAVVLALTGSWLAASSGAGQVLSDNFNDNLRGPFWSDNLLGTGPSLAQANGRLEITLPPDPTGKGIGGFTFVSDGYQSTCRVAGDFDIQVDYSLLTWPSKNGAWVLLQGFTGDPSDRGIFMARISPNASAGEQYIADVDVFATGFVFVPTSDRSGKFRITRVGSTGTSYYFSGGAWTQLASGQASTRDMLIQISLFGLLNSTTNQFGNQLVMAALDNFIVNQGTLRGCKVCSDASAAVDVVRPKLTIGKLNTSSGDDTLSFQGTMTLPSPFNPPLNPLANGVRLLIQDSAGTALDVTISGGAFVNPPGSGWKVNGSSTKWTYQNKTPATTAGIYKVVIQDKSAVTPGLVKFTVKGKAGSYPVASADLPVAARLTLAPPGSQCGNTSFSSCAFNGSGSTLRCK